MAAAVVWLLYLLVGGIVYPTSKLFCRKIRKQEKDESLSLTEAHEKANRLRLYKVKRDPATHLPIFGTQTPFRFLDSCETIGMESVGLGFYFYHLNMFLLILGILSLSYSINVGQYYNRMKYENSYTLKFVEGGELQLGNRTCNRPYNTHTAITRMSAGSLCVEGETSNAYFCPAICTVNLNESQSQQIDMQDPDLCAKHRPCSIQETDDCCDNQLNTEHKEYPFLSLWLCQISLMIVTGWTAFNKMMSNKLGERLNSAVITAADYTVLVSGIDTVKCTLSELTGFFRHYGHIAWSTPVPRIGTVVENKKELRQLEVLKKELDRHSERTLDTASLSGILFVLSSFGFPFFLKGTLLGFQKTVLERKRQIATRIQILEKEIVIAEERAIKHANKNKNTGQALVTFAYEKFTHNTFTDQYRPLDKTLSSLSCGLISRYPKFLGRSLKVQRAPEPSDFRWENTNIFGYSQGMRILLSNLIMFIVLVIGCLIQLLLEVWKAEALDDFAEYKVANSITKDDQEYLLKQLKVRSLSMTSSLAIVVVNLVMHEIVDSCSKFERWHTWSDTEKYLLLKLSTAYFLNSIAIPLLSSTKKNWYTEGGLAEQVFYTQLIDAVMAPAMALFDPTWLCSRLSCQYAKTQSMLDKILIPPEFSLSIRYSDTIKTLSMAIIFAPMVPTSPYIGFLGIFFQCATDRVVAFKVCQRPRQLQEGVMDMVFFLLRSIPLMQLGLMYYCFPQMRMLLLVVAAVWTVAFFASLSKGRRKKELEDAGTGGMSFKDASESCEMSADDAGHEASKIEDFFLGARLGEKVNQLFSDSVQEENPNSPGPLESQASISSKTESLKDSIKQKYFTYNPFRTLPMVDLHTILHSVISGALREKMNEIFTVTGEVCPPDTTLMMHQKENTGGPENTKKPETRPPRKSTLMNRISSFETNLKVTRSGINMKCKKSIMSIVEDGKRKNGIVANHVTTPNPLYGSHADPQL